MTKWILPFLAGWTFAIGLVVPLNAEETQSIPVPIDTKFVLRVDIGKFCNTPLGSKLIGLVKQNLVLEVSNEKTFPNPEKIKEILGFDPFEEIRRITIAGSDYEHPEQSMVAIVEMRQSTGNLEGMLLGLPGYKSEEYGKHEIHSASPDKDARVYGSIHIDTNGEKTIVLSPQKASVVSLLDQFDGTASKNNDNFKQFSIGGNNQPLFALEVFEFPKELGQGPQANIATILRGLSVRVTNAAGKLDIGMMLKAETEKQAEQIRQMAQGMIAMIDFAVSMDPDNEELKKLQQVPHEFKALRDGNIVNVGFSVAEDDAAKFIEQQIKDK